MTWVVWWLALSPHRNRVPGSDLSWLLPTVQKTCLLVRISDPKMTLGVGVSVHRCLTCPRDLLRLQHPTTLNWMKWAFKVNRWHSVSISKWGIYEKKRKITNLGTRPEQKLVHCIKLITVMFCWQGLFETKGHTGGFISLQNLPKERRKVLAVFFCKIEQEDFSLWKCWRYLLKLWKQIGIILFSIYFWLAAICFNMHQNDISLIAPWHKVIPSY